MRNAFLLLLCAALAPALPARALDAAAGKVDITPNLKTERVWLAGFGASGRRPAGVQDPLYARLLILREGDVEVAVVGADLLGLYRNDVEDLRRLSGFDAPGRSLLLASTHTHSGPDTLGMWGPMIGVSGVNREYQARLKARIAEALKLLESQLRPVRAEGGHGTLDPRGLCRDARDPQIIDPNLSVLRLVGRDGKAVATVVNWSCHPEVLDRSNRLISADFPGPLCARVEEKTGGACLFLNGVIGGLLTPDARARNFYEADRIGTAVADAALALKTRAAPSRPLAFRALKILLPIENSRYRLLLPDLVFGHRLFDAQDRPLPRWKAWTLALHEALFGLNKKTEPWIESEVSLLDVGPARLLGIPGEAFPELAIGGYSGRYTFGRPIVSPENPNPPDLAQAPKGPYWRDLLKAPAPMIVGLADDELGYFVPAYDFQVSPHKLMVPHPPGDHYEETESIGPSATGIVNAAVATVIKENK